MEPELSGDGDTFIGGVRGGWVVLAPRRSAAPFGRGFGPHPGGRPATAWPAARRQGHARERMACSSCSFSSFNSARILATSIMGPSSGRLDTGDKWPTSYGIHIKCVPSIQLYFPPA